MQADIEAYLKKCGSITGWFQRTDGVAFAHLSAHQVAAGLRGDLLEIGTYHGRSAILLGYLRQPGERLCICDLFADQPGPQAKKIGLRHYSRVSLDTTLANYRRFHAEAPVMFCCPSTELLARGLAPPFRFIHIDGSHSPAVMRQDLATARALSIPGGVVIFEDDHSVHSPGVPPGVRAAFEDGTLTALAISPGKTYACVGPDTLGLRDALEAFALTSADLVPKRATFAGQEILLLYPLPERYNPWRGLERKAGILQIAKKDPR